MSSGSPPAAIAVIRISGPDALTAASRLAGRLPAPRHAALRALRGAEGELLDRALVLVFPGPASATGEDLVELHCHGGRAVVDAVEATLSALPQVRRAEPGEFTRRALLNGRIDLTEAEGLADLLAAETETQRRIALAAAEGHVSRAIRGWMERIVILSARVEAAIDYAEEGDVEAESSTLADLATDRKRLAAEMAAILAAPSVERWRDGFRLVVAGPPNAGKSTLVNLLGGRDAAIVSPIAGTTRDRIEVPVRRKGVAYVLIDTAGLHAASDDPVEAIGMERARAAVDEAHLVLWMGDDASLAQDHVLRIHGRADLPGREVVPPGAVVAVSARDPASVEQLWQAIERHVGSLPLGTLPLHDRQRLACLEAAAALETGSAELLLEAEQLRRAHRALATVLGADATEQMLEALFSRFCVGK